jgi:hypothetical protein
MGGKHPAREIFFDIKFSFLAPVHEGQTHGLSVLHCNNYSNNADDMD